MVSFNFESLNTASEILKNNETKYNNFNVTQSLTADSERFNDVFTDYIKLIDDINRLNKELNGTVINTEVTPNELIGNIDEIFKNIHMDDYTFLMEDVTKKMDKIKNKMDNDPSYSFNGGGVTDNLTNPSLRFKMYAEELYQYFDNFTQTEHRILGGIMNPATLLSWAYSTYWLNSAIGLSAIQDEIKGEINKFTLGNIGYDADGKRNQKSDLGDTKNNYFFGNDGYYQQVKKYKNIQSEKSTSYDIKSKQSQITKLYNVNPTHNWDDNSKKGIVNLTNLGILSFPFVKGLKWNYSYSKLFQNPHSNITFLNPNYFKDTTSAKNNIDSTFKSNLKTIFTDVSNNSKTTNSYTDIVSEALKTSTQIFNNNIGRKSADVFGDDVNFAYENKYSIVVESPFKQEDKTKNYMLIDSIHMVSSSIPSLSIDILENKINNYRRKSAGNIIGDSFSIQFRDNAKREYYLFFQQWLQQMFSINTPTWDRKIKLYNYPDDYTGKIRFFMLKSNTDGITKDSNKSYMKKEGDNYTVINTTDGITKIINGSYMRKIGNNYTVINTTELDTSNIANSMSFSQEFINQTGNDKNPPLADDGIQNTIENATKFKTLSGSTVDSNLTEKNNYILYIIEFGHIFPSQLGDVILGSTSGELSTFDVTFEYSLPITYYEWDSISNKFIIKHTI